MKTPPIPQKAPRLPLKTMRLDVFLQREFSLRSRTYAENLILRGLVEVDGRVVKKPSFDVPEDCKTARILEDEGYASQGAYKLAEALRVFPIDLSGADCADIGCSNGGFTDLMLRKGAKSVFAVDVGECALPENILSDSRVTFLKANARELPPTADKDFLSADLSFISLTLVLPAFFGVLKKGGRAVVLVKPQFEAGKSALSKKGIVLSEKERKKAVEKVSAAAETAGFKVLGSTPSPVMYEDKNREYLLLLEK